MTDVVTSNNPGAHRYEAHIDGELAGFAKYHLSDEMVIITHTEVEERFEGMGVGSTLARFALDDVRADSRKVLPLCPFIKSWIGKHPEYADLVFAPPKTTAKD